MPRKVRILFDSSEIASIDLFTVPTARFRVLFSLTVLRHDRHRVLHFNVTEHPTAQWAAQQLVEAFPETVSARYKQNEILVVAIKVEKL